jgi:hypothetical protein
MNENAENAEIFVCEPCDFKCCKKSNYYKHLSTSKHQNRTKLTVLEQKEEKKCHICKYCQKIYSARNSLWYHEQKCTPKEIIKNEEPNDKDLIMMLIKDNSEFKNLMMKVLENGTNNNSNNTINSHNKAFNLQFFLNETCKDAMNIMDFVESIQLQLSDLEKMGEIGYVEGISNIIVKNLNALDITQRPVHCTDKKRETIYIKDEDKWEKDEEKNKIRKVIKKVAFKNARLIQKFKEKHPDYNEYHSKYSTQYHKLIIESFGGSGDNDLEKEDKIIRNISKSIVVDKDTK